MSDGSASSDRGSPISCGSAVNISSGCLSSLIDMVSNPSDNSHSDEERAQKNGRRHPHRESLHFFTRVTWPWFACPMATGAVAVVLAQQPNSFRGLRTIGMAFFIACVVIWLVFAALAAARFLRRPADFVTSLHHPDEALFFGSFWVTLALILNGIQQYGVPHAGPWLPQAMEVLFWVYCTCALSVAIIQYSAIFINEKYSVSSAMPGWVFPAYPSLVIGPLAGAMLSSQPPQSALRILIAGFTFQGLGWLVALFMYTIYITRLISSELPPPEIRPGIFVGVGPAGYTAAALVSLGSGAPNLIPKGALGLDENFDVGGTLKVVGLFSGMFIWLLAFWFCALSVVIVLHGVRLMSFTPNWWAFIFPNGGFVLATIQIGNTLESSAISAVASVMTAMLVALWLLVSIVCVRAVASGRMALESGELAGSRPRSADAVLCVMLTRPPHLAEMSPITHAV